MAKKPPIDVDLSFSGSGPDAQIFVTVTTYEPKYAGKSGVFEFEVEAKVNDSSPVNAKKSLYKRKFRIPQLGQSKRFTVPRKAIRFFSYDGQKIDINIHSRVTVERKLMLDTSIREKHKFDQLLKPLVPGNAASIIEPDDKFHFFRNVQAIPPHRKMAVLGLAAVGAIVMLINLLVGVHDQIVPEAHTWMYSQYDADGEPSSPVVLALTGSGVLGAGIWYAMRRQLRKYMTFRFKANLPKKITRGMKINVKDLIGGRTRVPLKRCRLRVVAANFEKGQYVRGSGTNRRTISFETPIRAVVVYETEIDRIPAKSDIGAWLPDDSFTFDKMFDALYPESMVSKTHGLAFRWEVQLIHPEFVDQELEGNPGIFVREDFMTLGHNESAASGQDAIGEHSDTKSQAKSQSPHTAHAETLPDKNHGGVG